MTEEEAPKEITPLDYALRYAALGWPVVPLHTPDADGICDCPKGVESKKGKTFGCTVIFQDGTSATVTVHVVSDGGRVSVSPADFHAH